MRKLCILVLMISLLCVSGCKAGNGAEESVKKFCDELAAAQSISFESSIRAHLGEEIFDFRVLCDYTEEEKTVEVLEPEQIAGIKAKISGDTASLQYEDIILSLGNITKSGLSPMQALPSAVQAMQTGYILSCYEEKSGDNSFVVAVFMLTDTVNVRVFFDKESALPLIVQLEEQGKLAASCTIENLKIE